MPRPSIVYFMYFTRIHSPFYSSVFNVTWWHSKWMVWSCTGMLLKACPMFIKFIYNVCVCQCHCFTWSYQPMTYICMDIVALTHIMEMFHFWTLENIWKIYGFLKFSGSKKKEQWSDMGLRFIWCCYDIVSLCAIFYHLKTYENVLVVWHFQRVKHETLA